MLNVCINNKIARFYLGTNDNEKAIYKLIKAFSQHTYSPNVVVRGVLQAMWEELAGKVVHRDQLIIC